MYVQTMEYYYWLIYYLFFLRIKFGDWLVLTGTRIERKSTQRRSWGKSRRKSPEHVLDNMSGLIVYMLNMTTRECTCITVYNTMREVLTEQCLWQPKCEKQDSLMRNGLFHLGTLNIFRYYTRTVNFIITYKYNICVCSITWS